MITNFLKSPVKVLGTFTFLFLVWAMWEISKTEFHLVNIIMCIAAAVFLKEWVVVLKKDNES